MHATIMEQWKPVVGYEGIYSVSNIGRIMRVRRGKGVYPGRLLSPNSNFGPGYPMIGLMKNKNRTLLYVHRIVAQAFIPNFTNLPEVNHIDCDPMNAAMWNLEWCTRQQNEDHKIAKGRMHRGEQRPNSKLNESMVRFARNAHSSGRTTSSLAKEMNVSQAALSLAISGKQWKHVK